MEHTEPTIIGRFANDPAARELAHEAADLLSRYTHEVVAEFALCPHLHDASALGAVCVVLDRELDSAAVARAIRATGRNVVHVVFPLADLYASAFERFGNAVAEQLVADRGPGLVHATFHPEMVGGTEYPARLVGVLRRSPDPLVQIIPRGISHGSGPGPSGYLDATYERVRGEHLQDLVARQLALRAERRRRYARFAERFGGFAW